MAVALSDLLIKREAGVEGVEQNMKTKKLQNGVVN